MWPEQSESEMKREVEASSCQPRVNLGKEGALFEV